MTAGVGLERERDRNRRRQRDRTAYYRARDAKYPMERRRARYAVSRAVRSGKLIKPKQCESCGASGVSITGHHEDYSKHLEVMWLCRPCHFRQHLNQGEISSIKLTAEQVSEIRNSPESNRSLARRFGVHSKTIYRIRHEISYNY